MPNPVASPRSTAELEAPTSHRLFVGLHISVATANGLASAVETLGRRARDARLDVRWTPAASYHLTLKYLGQTRPEAIGAVRDAIGRACTGVAPFGFRTARLGAFPALERATVLWAGVEDAAPILTLGAAIEREVTELGFPAETRPLVPHVTIARLGAPTGVKELLLPVSEQMFSETRVGAVILFETYVKNGVSSYREISRIEFKPARSGPERQTSALEMSPHTGTQDGSDSPDTDDGWPRGHLP
jgi:2'-5' RNA ligase